MLAAAGKLPGFTHLLEELNAWAFRRRNCADEMPCTLKMVVGDVRKTPLHDLKSSVCFPWARG